MAAKVLNTYNRKQQKLIIRHIKIIHNIPSTLLLIFYNVLIFNNINFLFLFNHIKTPVMTKNY